MPRFHLSVLVAATTLVAALPQRATAQAKGSTLVGWIRDAAGKPLADADVSIASMSALARTDSTGLFRLVSLDPAHVTVTIRRLGYDPETFEFTLHPAAVDSVAVTLQQNVQLLDAMRTNAALSHRFASLEEFYQRRDRGSGGMFLTRAEIERHHTTVLTEVLRELPNVRVLRGGGGRHAGIRFQSSSSRAQNCPPELWIDGQRARGTEIDDISATDVEAMELYSGPSTTPMQFSQQASTYSCGTIVIWTRLPGVP